MISSKIPELPSEILSKIFTEKIRLERNSAARVIAKYVSNCLYYGMYRCNMRRNLIESFVWFRGSDWISMILAYPGVRWEFKHNSLEWVEMLNDTSDNVEKALSTFEDSLDSGDWDVYLPIHTGL